MSMLFEKLFPVWLRGSLRNRAWLFALLTILLAVGVRVRLRDMPLERDEGEYAYAGQLLLHGVPPYKEAFNMKLPGTYVAYAAIMAIFGQTPTGIHLGLALVNAATIWLMFLLGRKLLDPAAGAAAAVTYGLMSLSPNVLGLAGHATHFVVLPAVGGIILLLHALEQRRSWVLALSGLLCGLAFVMKQHGLFFGVFGGTYLLWVHLAPKLFASKERRFARRPGRSRSEGEGSSKSYELIRDLAVFSLGFLVPYLLTCLWLWAAGVFPQFWFWTVTYGSKYAGAIPLVKASDVTSTMLRTVVGPNLIFWLLPWVGMLMMWWDERLDANRRFLLAALLLCSIASITVGFYFRQHYFIQLLPVLALLIAVAVSRSLKLLQGDQSIELFLALGVLVVSVIAAGAILLGNGSTWFTLPARKVVDDIYATTLFSDTRDAAEFIRANAAPDAKIAVVGSEPQIYFYARRRAATGFIYTYPLMESHPYAAQMQKDMISAIETAKPEYVVFVNNSYSWLAQADSAATIFDWWAPYWAMNLDLVRTINTTDGVAALAEQNPTATSKTKLDSASYLLILKRKAGL